MGALMFTGSIPVVPVSAAYEAEDAATVQMNTIKPAEAGDYSGSGYAESIDENSAVEFSVTVDKAGDYAVDLQYSNKEEEKTVSIYVNDRFVKESILPKTASEDTYGVKTETLSLEKGENKIIYKTSERASEGEAVLKASDISTGPLYWMAYETPFEQDHYLEESRWDQNVEWMASEGFVEAGYDMMSTDGWIEGAQVINENGYVTKYNYSWEKNWKEMSDQLAEKGMKLGVYYDPLWVTAAAYNSDAKIAGTEIPVSSLVNTDYGHFSNFKEQDVPLAEEFADKEWCQKGEPALYWLDTDKEGAEQYIKGYVKHFADAGVTFLRVDFLGWYENGIGGDNKQNGKPAYGTERYAKALKWMDEACEQYDIMLSLVMPNQYNHGETELKYGDMMRVNEDVANGGWDNSNRGPEKGWTNDHISGRRRGSWQKDWAQWGNSFDALTGWADVGGRGQMILDADFLRLSRFDVVRTSTDTERPLKGDEIVVADAQKRSAVSLVAISGSPICIADQYDSLNEFAPAGVDNKTYYLNEEILNLNKTGFVGKPMGLGESERWAGQLQDGTWVVALFNRDREVKKQTLDFEKDLGITGSASVRELWSHEELGSMKRFSVNLAACDCVVLKITPQTTRYEAEVGSLRDGANSNKNHNDYSGWGFADKLEKFQGDVLFAVNAKGTQNVYLRYCNGGKESATATLYINENKVQDVELVPTGSWDSWGMASVEGVVFSTGENILDIKCSSENGFNLDYVEIGTAGIEPAKKIHTVYEAENAEIGSTAKVNTDHQLASDGRFVDGLDQQHWMGSNDTVKFTISVKEEGDYDLTFRYANGGGDATADIFVDDQKLGYFTFPTVYPNAWDTWGEVTLHEAQQGGDGIQMEKVHLTEGTHTVWYKHGNNAMNMDCLTVTGHVVEAVPRRVVRIGNLDKVIAAEGTAFENLNLPAAAEVYLDGEEESVSLDVVWNQGIYDPQTAGEYVVFGNLQLQDGMENLDQLQAQITVEVMEGVKQDLSSQKQMLSIVYDAYKDMETTGIYTKESAAVLQTALTAAQSAMENPDVSEEELTNAASGVLKAAAGLVLDTADMETRIAAAEEEAKKANDLLKELQAQTGADRDLIDAAKDLAETAKNTAEAAVREAKKAMLLTVYHAYKDMDTADIYTQESAAALRAALTAAENAIAKADVSEEELANAASGVLKAATGLVLDTADMETRIAAAEEEAKKANDLLKELQAQTGADKDLIDAAKDLAETAKNTAEAAVKEAKKAMLVTVYDAYKDLDLAGYTEDSAKALKDALETAKNIQTQEDAEEAMILDAVTAIMKAAAELKIDTSVQDQAVTDIRQELQNAQDQIKIQNAEMEALVKQAEEAKRLAEEAGKAAAEIKQAFEDIQNKKKEEQQDTPVKTGEVYESAGYLYRVTDIGKKTAAVAGSSNQALKRICIANEVTIKGTSYKVTKVEASAFKKFKKATTVILGKNVKEIGSRAFYGNKLLKNIVVKSAVLKKAGKKAFAGTAKNVKVKLPAKRKAALKKLLKKSGISKNAVIK